MVLGFTRNEKLFKSFRKGHSSIVHELKASLPSKPGAIVVSVGGGGLFSGIMEGLDEVGWGDVPVLCMETVGADCLNVAWKARDLVTLPDITRYELRNCLESMNNWH